MITKYPIGLLARTEYFRVLKSIWTQEVKDFVISRIKSTSGNQKPVIVIDDVTKLTKCYYVNNTYTDFIEITGLDTIRLCRKVESIADWQINKVIIQKSLISVDEKEKICRTLEHRDYRHSEITIKDKSELGYGLQDTQDKIKYQSALSDVGLTYSLDDIKPKPTEKELDAFKDFTIDEWKTEIKLLQEKYPVYADEINEQLQRRNITPAITTPDQLEEELKRLNSLDN